MKINHYMLTIVITKIILSAFIANAEPIGTAFTYQGKLIDAGEPANGLYDLQFALFDDEVAGSQQGGTVTKEDIETTDGFFTVQLDFGSDVFTGDARWLQVEVRPGLSTDPNDFVALNPLQELTAAPYAASAYEVTGRVRTAGIYEDWIYGNTWTPKESDRYWYSVAMSADGQIQTALDFSNGQIYVSTDFGNTWTPKGLSGYWCSVAMSADGQIQTAVDYAYQIYVSTDYGDTWAPKESNRQWTSVAMSEDGKIQTAVSLSSLIYVSADYGNTWAPRESNRSWASVAMSADGQIQTAVVGSSFTGTGSYGQIYVSTDFGNIWTPKESTRDWYSVAMSADGKLQTAVVNGGYIYVSTDFGDTWAPKELFKRWRSVAMSEDGKIQTAVSFYGLIYVSADYGNTWAPRESNRSWHSVAMSADGQIQTAVVRGGKIYVSISDVIGVGLGKMNPSAKLDVEGDALISGNTSISGNIGIGTLNPTNILEIRGNSFMPSIILQNTDTTDGHVGITLIRGNHSAENSISFQDPDDTEIWKIGMDNAPEGTESDFVIKSTDNAEAEFSVKSDGTVKIGAWHDQLVSTNGYTWIGNILYQWGTGISSSDDAQTFTFPIPFPNQCFTANPTIPCRVTLSKSGFTIDRHNDYDDSIAFTYLAIGH